MKNASKLVINGQSIPLGQTVDIHLPVSETYLGFLVSVPIHIFRAKKPGPTVFVTAAIHGDELTGVGIIRELMIDPPKLLRGTLICVPVANISGFENHSRYLPDRRDLNRSFPGNKTGNLALRLANVIYREIVEKSDYGIDLHSAATRRTNFPHVRANLKDEKLKEFAFAFGCEIVVHSPGVKGTLRESADKCKCKTILYEAGEALKCEQMPVNIGVRGVHNILKYLKMEKGDKDMPVYQTSVYKAKWVRSEDGGFLRFNVTPGQLLEDNQLIATCHKIFNNDIDEIRSSEKGIILGMTTLPAVKPGEPVCHVAKPSLSMNIIKKRIAGSSTLHRTATADLSTNFHVARGKKKTVPRKRRQSK